MPKDKTLKGWMIFGIIIIALGIVSLVWVTLSERAKPDVVDDKVIEVKEVGATALVDVAVLDYANADMTTEITSGTGLFYTVNNILTGNNVTLTATYTIGATVGAEVCGWYWTASYTTLKKACITVSETRANELEIPVFATAATSNIQAKFYGNTSNRGDEVFNQSLGASETGDIRTYEIKVNVANKAWNFKGVAIGLVTGTNLTRGGRVSLGSPVQMTSLNTEFRTNRKLPALASESFQRDAITLSRIEDKDIVYTVPNAILMLQWDTLVIPGMLLEADVDGCLSTGEPITFTLFDEGPFLTQTRTVAWGPQTDDATPEDTGIGDVSDVFFCM